MNLGKKRKIIILGISVIIAFLLILLVNNASGKRAYFKINDLGNKNPVQSALIKVENSTGCPLAVGVKCDSKSWEIVSDISGSAILKKLKRDVYSYTVSAPGYEALSESFTIDKSHETIQIDLLPSNALVLDKSQVWGKIKNDERVREWFINNGRESLLNEEILNAAEDGGRYWIFSFNIFEPCAEDQSGLCPGETIRLELDKITGEINDLSTYNQNK